MGEGLGLGCGVVCVVFIEAKGGLLFFDFRDERVYLLGNSMLGIMEVEMTFFSGSINAKPSNTTSPQPSS